MGSPDQLRVRLLGGLEVEGLDARAIGSRKARTLVKVLALSRGAPVSADAIAEALWPGDDRPAKPQDQIGVLVSRLRGVLGAERLVRSDAGWTLRCDWLDVVELGDRVEEAAARFSAGSHGAARAAVRAALALVRGELVADEPDAPWAEIDRARVARDVARARMVAAEAALAAGDPADAAAVAEGALDHDPYDEAALRVLMRAHAAAGRPASALAAYAHVRERLVEDLGVDPVKETEELHTAILLGEESVASVAASESRADVSIVGRERELTRLDALYAEVERGSVAAVVIEGEAGIGKTALVDAWLASVPAATRFVGRCEELGRGLPLQPLFDALAAHLREHDRDFELPPGLAAFVGPVASSSGDQPMTVPDPVLGQSQLFADLLAALQQVSGAGPCIVVVEDVHLAARSTVAWLHYAAHRGHSLLLIATQRPGGDAGGEDFVHLSLAPLTLRDVAALVGQERAPGLLERSGGNPLFLVELAAAGEGELPLSVRDAVGARVDGLGPAAMTLRAAAILGTEIDVDLLSGVAGEPVPVLLEHLEAGERARIIEERGPSLVFPHELVREALVAGTTAARRAFIHREAARVLAQRPRHDPLQVAWHAQRGGDTDTATSALVRAAGIAADRFDMTLAEELLTSAITLGESLDAYLARARVRIATWDIAGARMDAQQAIELVGGAPALEVAAWVEYYGRDYDLAFRYGEEAVARSDDAGLRASCLAMTGRVAHAKGELRDAERRLVEAVDTAPPAVRGFAQAWLAGLRMHQGAPTEALDLVDRALAERRWLGHPFALHHGNFFRILALGHQGRVPEALAAFEVAHSVALSSGEAGARFAFGVVNAKTWLLRGVGRVESTVDDSLRIYEETAASTALAEMHHASMLDLLESALLVGSDDDVLAAITRAAPVDTMHGTMAWHHRQRYWVQQARFALRLGELGRARELATRAVADAGQRRTPRYGSLATIVLARVDAAENAVVDHDAINVVLERLDQCAGLEAWLVTAELAAATGVDRWWRDAERRAGALVASSGEHGETLRTWVGTQFTALGRR